MAPKNIKVTNAVNVEILTEAGYRCSVPTCRNTLAIDLHHLIHVAEGGESVASNLLALCPYCHGLYHRGTIHNDSIKFWKYRLEALNMYGHCNIEMPKSGDNKKEFLVAVRIAEKRETFIFPDRASRQSFLNHIEFTGTDWLVAENNI